MASRHELLVCSKPRSIVGYFSSILILIDILSVRLTYCIIINLKQNKNRVVLNEFQIFRLARGQKTLQISKQTDAIHKDSFEPLKS